MRIDEVRDQSIEDLMKELTDQERGLMNLRFRKATLQLPDVSELRKARRTIARIRTVIRERQIAEAGDAS
jgi:large subunit ribosomal protein L29